MKIYKQETKNSCGVACLRSILNCYGNNFSEKDIWDNINSLKLKNGGIRNPIVSLGSSALKLGFKVTYCGYNPILTNRNNFKDLKKSLLKKSKTYSDYWKFLVDETIRFIDLGGKIIFDKLSLKKIKDLVDENKFLLIELRPAFIDAKTLLSMIHKVIIIGYTKKGFKILNPIDAKEYLWDFDTFLLAFYSAIPELLIIKEG